MKLTDMQSIWLSIKHHLTSTIGCAKCVSAKATMVSQSNRSTTWPPYNRQMFCTNAEVGDAELLQEQNTLEFNKRIARCPHKRSWTFL